MATSGLRIFGRRRNGHEDRSLSRQSVPPSMLPDTAGSTVGPGNALAIADVFACVRALSDAAASLPLHVYRHASAGRERVENQTAELLRHPAPAVTMSGLVGQIVCHLNLHGNAYLGKFRDGSGRINQLSLLAPDRVTPRLVAGRPRYRLTGLQGEQSDHGTEDIIHVKALTVDGLVGLSPVRQCRVALGLSQQLTEHASSFFANGARPGGILRLNRFGDADEQASALRDAWEAQHRGTANAHRIAVVTGEVEFTPLSMQLDDVEFIEQRKLSAQEVARIFRVPPHVIGAPTGETLTYSNAESQALDFVKFSLRPWLVQIEQALSADEDLFGPGTYCEFLLDALLRADSATRADVYSKALDPLTGWLSRAEVRQLENLPADG